MRPENTSQSAGELKPENTTSGPAIPKQTANRKKSRAVRYSGSRAVAQRMIAAAHISVAVEIRMLKKHHPGLIASAF